MKKILTIDGGGIRGVLPARILHEIEKRMKKPISEIFDLIAGTSTGGILALCLTKPDAKGKPRYKALDILKFYDLPGNLQCQWEILLMKNFPLQALKKC